MASIEERVIRKRVIEALSRAEDWRIRSTSSIEREDGLRLEAVGDRWDVIAIFSRDHDVAQANIDMDEEVRTLWFAVTQIGMGTDPARRPALKLLGAAW